MLTALAIIGTIVLIALIALYRARLVAVTRQGCEAGLQTITRSPLSFSETIWIGPEQIGDDLPAMLPGKIVSVTPEQVAAVDHLIRHNEGADAGVAVMPVFKLTHRATRLTGADPAMDREVLCDGRPIARVRQIESGQQAGLWHWSAYCIGNDTRGTAGTLAEGLDAIKSRVDADALDGMPPAR